MSAIEFLRTEFPSMFAAGVAALEAKAASSEGAHALLEDIRSASGVGRIVIEQRGEIWFEVNSGTMGVIAEPAAERRVDLFVAMDGAVADVLLEVASRDRDLRSGEAAILAARLVSARLQKALANETQSFVLTVKDTPDFERVEVRVALGLREFPAKPRFTVELKYADLERVERGELTPQQFFMGGKLKFGGDYARALQIAMALATPKNPAAPKKK
jgi:putative sterol carrier protein